MKRYLLLLLFFSLFLGGCGKKGKADYRIAVDSTWYPIDFMGKSVNVLLFSDEILKEIAIMKKIKFEKIGANWDTLFDGLYEKKYEAVLSSMRPFLFNKSRFDFSMPYLLIGPVLVVRSGSNIKSLKECSGKEIAVDPNGSGLNEVQKHPEIIIRNYTSIAEGLQAIANGAVDGALIPIIPAISFITDIYHGKLKIVTPPLTDEGLRLLTLHGKNEKLIKIFDSGLEKLKSSGRYNQIAKKWGLFEG